MSDQAEQAVEDRMTALLDMQDDDVGDEPQEQAESFESESSTDQEKEQETSEEQTTTLTLKRGDEEIEVSLDEAKNLAQQGYDYTKKTQELAEQRKHTELYAQTLRVQDAALRREAEMQNVFIRDLAKIESLSEQIAQFEGLDWSALSDSDPVQAQKLWISFQQLQTKRTQGHQEIQQKHQIISQQRAMRENMQLEMGRAELGKYMPDFNEEKAQAIKNVARGYGYTDDELSNVYDPRFVRMAADAAEFRKLQSDKPGVSNKVAGKPAVVKPGTKDAKVANRAQNAQLRQRLKQTGSDDIAAALIERTL